METIRRASCSYCSPPTRRIAPISSDFPRQLFPSRPSRRISTAPVGPDESPLLTPVSTTRLVSDMPNQVAPTHPTRLYLSGFRSGAGSFRADISRPLTSTSDMSNLPESVPTAPIRPGQVSLDKPGHSDPSLIRLTTAVGAGTGRKTPGPGSTPARRVERSS
jgi:hypothetical protein